MRKDIAGLVGPLRTSVLGITASAADNPDGLLSKSFDEFGTALSGFLDERFGPEEEPLAKGLNHISAFASALNRMNQTVNAIKTGRPAYMIDTDGAMPAEPIQEETTAALERFMRVGVLTLRSMVNDSAELPEGDEDLERAERAGTLFKIESEHGAILVKSDLPEHLRVYLDDPVEVMIDTALTGREFIEMARFQANELIKGEPAVFNDQLANAFPEVFEVPSAEEQAIEMELEDALEELALYKANFPPPKKKPAGQTDNTSGGGPVGGQDEDVGDGGDPNDNAQEDPDATDDGTDGMTGDGADGMADGAPANPLETMVRLASIIVVIGGSLLQGQGQSVDGADGQGSVDPGDADNVGLQRGEPVYAAPLEKIMNGEAFVDATVLDALEEREALLKRMPEMEAAMQKLQATVTRMQAQPAQPLGRQRVVSVAKSEDVSIGLEGAANTIAAEVDTLRKDDPGAAARLLIKAAHAGGGRPMLPPG
jgi:hypothetical protein